LVLQCLFAQNHFAMWWCASICTGICLSEQTCEVVSMFDFSDGPPGLLELRDATMHSGTHGTESGIERSTVEDKLERCDSGVLRAAILHGTCRRGVSVDGESACIDKTTSSDVAFMKLPRAKQTSKTPSEYETFGSVDAKFYTATPVDGDSDLEKPIVFPNGCKYFGKLKNGKGHGKGTFVWPSGQIYDGEYVKGRRHGQGLFIWSDGRWFRGEHRNGLQHGRGQAGDTSGYVVEGVWENGKRVK